MCIGILKSKKLSADESILKVENLNTKILSLKELEKIKEDELQSILKRLPNIPHSSTPIGQSENDNFFYKEWGTKPVFNFKAKKHFEIGEDINLMDFEIASKRCKHFVKKATKYFKAFGVTNILVAMTGDLLNSDRRLDELLNMATNRAKATFLAVDILQQVIMDLNSNFNVSVAMVTGNESRVKKDWGWSKTLASDNYDFTIFKTLSTVIGSK